MCEFLYIPLKFVTLWCQIISFKAIVTSITLQTTSMGLNVCSYMHTHNGQTTAYVNLMDNDNINPTITEIDNLPDMMSTYR